MSRRLTFVAFAVAFTLLGVACGDSAKTAQKRPPGNASLVLGDDAAASTESKDVPADADAPSTASAKGESPQQSPSAAKGSGAPVAAGSASPTTTLNTKAFEGDFVFGSPHGMSQDDPRPANCAFKPGQLCRFTVAGTYGLKTADVASIEVGAYEDGSNKPAYSTTLPNARKGSSRWFVDDFPYRASAGAKEVAILVRLLDPSGQELARGNPTRFPISGA